MKTMKKLSTVLFAALMAVLMTVITPLRVFAEAQPIYISEFRIGHSREELTQAGFEIADYDLNAETGETDVFIGYKTTNDPDIAITDLKALQQENGYTIFDSQEIMSALDGEALEDAIYLKQMVDVFRANYEANQNFAKSAYNIFQQYQYSDTQNLGDFLLDPNLTANDLTDIILNAATETSSGMYMFLCAALMDNSGENCFTRFRAGSENDYEIDNVLKSKTRALLTSLRSYRLALIDEISNISEEKSDEEYGNAFNTDLLMSMDLLESIPFNDSNLLTAILSEDLKMDDLYDLAACMTDAEVQAMKFLGFSQFTNILHWSDGDLKDKVFNVQTDQKLDFWEGSTKQEYSRIAITNSVMQKMILGNTEAYQSLVTTKTSVAIGVTSMCAVGTVISSLYYANRIAVVNAEIAADAASAAAAKATNMMRNAIRQLPTIVKNASGGAVTMGIMDSISLFRDAARIASPPTAQVAFASAMYRSLPANAQKALYGITYNSMKTTAIATTTTKTSLKAVSSVATASIVLLVVAIVITVIFFIIDLVSYYSPSYSEMPKVVLSEETLADGSTGYVYYNAVLRGDGSVGDTNGYEGKKWNALYSTTSQTKGTPIRAGSFYANGDISNVPAKTAVSLFGQSRAFDLNTNVFSHDADVYLYFDHVEENTLASVFTEHSTWIIAGGSCLILIAGAMVALMNKNRKKVSVEADTSANDTETTQT